MDAAMTVALYGDSLGVSAIGAGLATRPGWRVIPVDAHAPEDVRRISQLHLDVLLFDLAGATPESIISFMQGQPTLLIIGVDLLHHQALVLSGAQPALCTSGDLVRLIETQSVDAQAKEAR